MRAAADWRRLVAVRFAGGVDRRAVQDTWTDATASFPLF